MEQDLRDINTMISKAVIDKLEKERTHEAAFFLGVISTKINYLILLASQQEKDEEDIN